MHQCFDIHETSLFVFFFNVHSYVHIYSLLFFDNNWNYSRDIRWTQSVSFYPVFLSTETRSLTILYLFDWKRNCNSESIDHHEQYKE